MSACVLAALVGCSDAPAPAKVPQGSRRPPARPSSVVPGERRWFVVKEVFLGVRNRETRAPDPFAWKQYGLDLDRRATSREDSKTSDRSCKRIAGSSTGVLTDGVEGIDNNFGCCVLPVAKSAKSDFEDVANAEIANGGFTLLLRIDGVTTNTASAPGALYVAGPRAANGAWPVWSSTLAGGRDLEAPVRTFPLGYVRDGVWVSGEIGESPAPIWIPLFGAVAVDASALITLELATGRGVIAGALPRASLVKTASAWAVKLGICPGEPTFDQVVDTMTQSADLVLGAPDLQDTARQCDAVSFGIGFDVAPTSAPSEVVPAPPDAPVVCAPSTADAGTSD